MDRQPGDWKKKQTTPARTHTHIPHTTYTSARKDTPAHTNPSESAHVRPHTGRGARGWHRWGSPWTPGLRSAQTTCTAAGGGQPLGLRHLTPPTPGVVLVALWPGILSAAQENGSIGREAEDCIKEVPPKSDMPHSSKEARLPASGESETCTGPPDHTVSDSQQNNTHNNKTKPWPRRAWRPGPGRPAAGWAAAQCTSGRSRRGPGRRRPRACHPAGARGAGRRSGRWSGGGRGVK